MGEKYLCVDLPSPIKCDKMQPLCSRASSFIPKQTLYIN